MSIHQISVFLENRTGQLAEITNILAERNIDLRAISIADTADYGVLRLIVDRPQEATSILLDNGFILSMTPVLVVAVPDKPGGLAELLQLLSESDMDIEYMYSLFSIDHDHAYMVLRVTDERRFCQLLDSQNITIATSQELDIQ